MSHAVFLRQNVEPDTYAAVTTYKTRLSDIEYRLGVTFTSKWSSGDSPLMSPRSTRMVESTGDE